MSMGDIVKYGVVIILIAGAMGFLSERKAKSEAKIEYERIVQTLDPDKIEDRRDEILQQMREAGKPYGFRLADDSVQMSSSPHEAGRAIVVDNKLTFKAWSSKVLFIPRPVTFRVTGSSQWKQIRDTGSGSIGATVHETISTGIPNLDPGLKAQLEQRERDDAAQKREMQLDLQRQKAAQPDLD